MVFLCSRLTLLLSGRLAGSDSTWECGDTRNYARELKTGDLLFFNNLSEGIIDY